MTLKPWWNFQWVDAQGRVTMIVTEPPADAVVHDRWSTRCICGPKVIPIMQQRGVFATHVVHHALDGRA